MILIAIDGACKNNGKPDCVSASAMLLHDTDTSKRIVKFGSEQQSTNQRGEILALILALHEIVERDLKDTIIVSDSEFIVNTINKEWYKNWPNKGWVNASGDPIKNQDLWEQVISYMQQIEDLTIYHIKGHSVSIGKVLAMRLLDYDTTGDKIMAQIDKFYYKHPNRLETALETFKRVHEFEPPEDIFKMFIKANTLVDYYACHKLERVLQLR